MDKQTYCVRRTRRNCFEGAVIAAGLESMAEAAELALRLYRLQEMELGGTDEFCAAEE